MKIDQAASTLGVHADASEKEIIAAYRSIAVVVHPDRNRDNPTADRRMAEVNEARDILISHAKTRRPSPPAAKQRKPAAPSKNEDRRSTQRTTSWPAPPVTPSEFFESRGYILRPTTDRVSFRVIGRASGTDQGTLVRHPDDGRYLCWRDKSGRFVDVDGLRFWLDIGTSVEPVEGAPSGEKRRGRGGR